MAHWENIGKSDEWYTPKYIFDALGCDFDMDVAGPVGGSHCPTNRVISSDSLRKPWHGFIWMNPPFGGRNGLKPWLHRFFEIGNGIALVPDRTSAPWFQEYAEMADSILLISPKIKFERSDGSRGKSPSTGTALFAAGDKAYHALLKARNLGLLVRNVT